MFFHKFASKLSFIRSSSLSHTFKLEPINLYNLPENSLKYEITLNKNQAIDYYTKMKVIRLMETEANLLYKDKQIRGFCHLYIGQEAVCVGANSELNNDDSVITAYRSHGWTYIKGTKVSQILCELTGRKTGCSGGKGGSMHTYYHEFYGGNGIVGAQVPLGVGIAFAHKYKNNGQICIALYGDGASNQGQLFEVYNMAALWKLPVIFACENNLYGMGTSIERSSFNNEFHTRAGFIPGIKVDGNCLLSVKMATKFCADYCRNNQGPICIEYKTYRYMGHSMSDPGTSYRTVEEVQNVRKNYDPIIRFMNKIVSVGLVEKDELKKIDERIEEEIQNDVKKSLEDPYPSVENDLGTFVYQGKLVEHHRGCDPMSKIMSN